MAIEFVPIPGIDLAVLAVPGVVSALRSAAQHMATEAAHYAPREPTLRPGRRRHYADMIGGYAGYHNGLPLGRVCAFHYTSNWIEFGTSHMPAFAPLRKALDASRGKALL